VRDANSLLRYIKAFEKKLGDLHVSDPESGMIEADKAKIRRHLDGIQEYMSEAISITTQSVAAGDHEPVESAADDAHKPVGVARLSYKTRTIAPGDHEPQELAVEEPDSESAAAGDHEPAESAVEEPDYEDCASNIDSEGCGGLNNCYSCCSDACGDVPDIEDERACASYQFCIADCRDHCLLELMACIVRTIQETTTGITSNLL
jgi:hypothetical protein